MLLENLMGFGIRYLVPYQVNINAIDNGSGRKVSNIMYYRSAIQTTAPPAYGALIAGPGSTTTLLAAILNKWIATVMLRLNANYILQSGVMVALVGKRYSSPFTPIFGVSFGTPVTIITNAPHGLTTGQVVSIQGVTSPASLNTSWTVTVVGTFTFTLNSSSMLGPWTGDGQFQVVSGSLEFLTTDLETLSGLTNPGSVVGDALPLFATSSVRRLNGGVGRNFRSRFSLSPMSEVDVLDGGFTAAQKALMVTDLGLFNVGIGNGGSDATSAFSFNCVVSKKVAFSLVTPFNSNSPWSFVTQSMVQQRNNGSMVRRKPKLTSVIV